MKNMKDENRNQRISPNYVYGRIPSLTSLENKKVKRVILQNGFNEPKILEQINMQKLPVQYGDLNYLKGKEICLYK